MGRLEEVMAANERISLGNVQECQGFGRLKVMNVSGEYWTCHREKCLCRRNGSDLQLEITFEQCHVTSERSR